MPTIQIPRYFQLQHVNVALLTPYTTDCAGLATSVDGSAFDIKGTGIADRMTFNLNRGLFEYSPDSAGMENFQPGKNSFDVELACVDGSQKAQPLLDLYGTYDICRVALRGGCAPFGATSTGKYLVLLFQISDIGTGAVGGKNATVLRGKPCGIAPQWLTTPTI